jgi:ppGpp synthetase/RelA/SpoT-type nucleotidyltranferase
MKEGSRWLLQRGKLSFYGTLNSDERSISMSAPLSAQAKALIEETCRRYKREYDRYQKMVEQVHLICRDLVRDAQIPATTQARAKDPNRLEDKLKRIFEKADEKERNGLGTPDAFLARVGDLAGVRITTYLESDRALVVEKLEKAFAGRDGGPIKTDVMDGRAKCEDYRATHCEVALKPEHVSGMLFNLDKTFCEIQVCSLLAHVFNEIEHDIGYKPKTGEIGKEEKLWIKALAGVTRQGDTTIQNLLDALKRRQAADTSDFEDSADFLVRVRPKFPHARAFDGGHQALFQDLAALRYRGPKDLSHLLSEGYEQKAQDQLAELRSYLHDQGRKLDLDSESSDLLLMLLLDKDCKKVQGLYAGSVGQGKGRPPRIYSIAKYYYECFHPGESDVEQSDEGDDYADPAPDRMPQYNFHKMGLAFGQKIVFVNPDKRKKGTTATIAGPRKVRLRGSDYYFTNATEQLVGGPLKKRPFNYWKYRNRSLMDLYIRTYSR